MPYIEPINPERADARSLETLDVVRKKLGKVPNLLTTLAQSHAALNGYLQLQEALIAGGLSPRQREIVALAVGQQNTCQYCLSAHTLLGKRAGLNDDDVRLARAGSGREPLDAAVANVAQAIVRERGRVPTQELERARAAGVDDALMLEIVAHVALNVLTNYTNHIAGTEVDFPVVSV